MCKALLAVLGATALLGGCAGGTHYAVDATLDPATAVVEAQAKVTWSGVDQSGPHRLVLARRMSVAQAVTDDGLSLAAEPTDHPFPDLQALSIPRREGSGGKPRELSLAWRGPVERLQKVEPGTANPMRRAELFLDTAWLPIDDDLRPFTAELVLRGLPQDWGFVADGELERIPDGLRVRRKRSGIDVNLIAEPQLRQRNAEGFELYAGAHDEAAVAMVSKAVEQVLAHHTRLFGPSPHRTLRVVLADRLSGPSYARGGFVVLRQASSQPPHPLALASLAAHELTHAWLPLKVSASSEDYWMVEAIPTYMANRYVMEAGAPVTPADWERARRALTSMGPVLGQGRAEGAVVYRKGSILLADLEAQIGRRAMDQILRNTAKRPPSSTGAFLAEIRKAAGAQAALEFEAALRRTGYQAPSPGAASGS